MSIKEWLKELVEKEGVEVFENTSRIDSMLSDLYPKEKKERNAIKSAFNNGIEKDFMQLLDIEDKSKYSFKINQIKDRIQNNLFLSEEASNFIVETFIYMFGLEKNLGDKDEEQLLKGDFEEEENKGDNFTEDNKENNPIIAPSVSSTETIKGPFAIDKNEEIIIASEVNDVIAYDDIVLEPDTKSLRSDGSVQIEPTMILNVEMESNGFSYEGDKENNPLTASSISPSENLKTENSAGTTVPIDKIDDKGNKKSFFKEKKKVTILVAAIVVGILIAGLIYYNTVLRLSSFSVDTIELERGGDSTYIEFYITPYPDSARTDFTYEIIEGDDYFYIDEDGEITTTAEIIEGDSIEGEILATSYNGLSEVIDIKILNTDIVLEVDTITLGYNETFQIEPTMTLNEDVTSDIFSYYVDADDYGITVDFDGLISTGEEKTTEPVIILVSLYSNPLLSKEFTVNVIDRLEWNYSETTRDYADGAGSWTIYPMVLKNELKNCMGITYSYAVTENSTYTNIPFKVIGKSSSGGWVELGRFTSGDIDEAVETKLTFSSRNIKEITAVPIDGRGSGSWSRRMNLLEATFE